MGSVIGPVCESCDVENVTEADPFSSFPSDSVPLSLVGHWSPASGRGASDHQGTSFKSHVVEYLQEDHFLQEEINRWSAVFRSNLEDMLSKWDEMLNKMVTRLDDAA